MENTIYCPPRRPSLIHRFECILLEKKVEKCLLGIFGRNTSFDIHAVIKINMRDGYENSVVVMWRKLHKFVIALEESGRNIQNKYLSRREFNHIFQTTSEQQINLHEFCNWREQFALSMLTEDELLEEEAAGKKRSVEPLMSKQDTIQVEDPLKKNPNYWKRRLLGKSDPASR